MNNYLDFIREDVEIGLLKNKRVGMIRRTLSFKGGVRFEGFSYLPYLSDFIFLRVKGRFENV